MNKNTFQKDRGSTCIQQVETIWNGTLTEFAGKKTTDFCNPLRLWLTKAPWNSRCWILPSGRVTQQELSSDIPFLKNPSFPQETYMHICAPCFQASRTGSWGNWEGNSPIHQTSCCSLTSALWVSPEEPESHSGAAEMGYFGFGFFFFQVHTVVWPSPTTVSNLPQRNWWAEQEPWSALNSFLSSRSSCKHDTIVSSLPAWSPPAV